MPEVQITMLGASGTGKTTTLTSIHEQMKPIGEKLSLELNPNDETETKEILDANLALLKQLENEIVARERDKKKKGIAGTNAISPDSLPSYIFDLITPEEKNLLRLIFRDYPGGYLTTERDFVKNLLRDSVSAILTIDTPAMKERNSVWHNIRNQPEEVVEAFQAAYTSVKEPRLIILAPVKCEKYVKNPQGIEDLLNLTLEMYQPILDFLSKPSRSDNFAVLFAPIQTVGCHEFSRVEELDGPRFIFRKTSTNATYSPQCTDQLFIYLLRFLLKQSNDKKMIVRSEAARFFRGFFNHKTVFETSTEVLKKLNNDRKKCGFKILQGGHLFG